MAELIRESGVEFGEFEDTRLFKIENSDIHKRAGAGIKTVEFIYLTKKDHILFVEAKSSCPNFSNKNCSEEKERKYEEFYADVTDKFIDSLNMFAAMALGRNKKSDSVGELIYNRQTYAKAGFKFVLVVTNAEESWLGGPKAELEARLLRFRKIWKADVIVLNTQMAQEYGLVKKV